MKYCFDCQHVLTDEFVEVDGKRLDIFDCLDELARKLGLTEQELEGRVVYYCPNCKTVYLVDFGGRSIKWFPWESMYRTFVACGRRMMSFEGEVRLRGGYVEGVWTRWVEVGGRKLVDMLKEMGWWTSSRPARVRVTIEVLDPGRDFDEAGEE